MAIEKIGKRVKQTIVRTLERLISTRNLEDYKWLCKSCHKNYDLGK